MDRYTVTILWEEDSTTATVSAMVYNADGEIEGMFVEPPADFDAPIVALALAHHQDAFPRLF